MKILIKNTFFRNLLTLFTASTLAQAIPILISPILTRLFSPNSFGLLGLYSSLTTILSMAVTLRYELAIVLPKNKNTGQNLFLLSVLLSLFFSLVLFAITLLFRNNISQLFKAPELSVWLLLLPFSVLFNALLQIFRYFFNRNRKYRTIATVTVGQSIGISSGQLITGICNLFSNGGLIIGQFFGNLIAVFLYLKKFLSYKLNKFSIEGLINAFKRYSNFPKFELGSGLLNGISGHMPIFLLGVFFNSTVLGYYAFAHRLISLPISLLGKSLGQVYYKEACVLTDKPEELAKLTFDILKKLLLIGVIPFALISAFGDKLFYFIFGSEWEIAGKYAQYLSAWLFITFLSSPLSVLFNAFELQKVNLKFNSAFFTLRLCIILVGGLIFKNPLITIILFSIGSMIMWLILLIYLLKLTNINMKQLLFYSLKIIIPTYCFFFILRYILLLIW